MFSGVVRSQPSHCVREIEFGKDLARGFQSWGIPVFNAALAGQKNYVTSNGCASFDVWSGRH